MYETVLTKAVDIRHFMMMEIVGQTNPIILKANLKKLRKDMKAFVKYTKQQHAL